MKLTRKKNQEKRCKERKRKKEREREREDKGWP